MPRRNFKFEPLGNMRGVFRPVRVGSKTCPLPKRMVDGTICSDVDSYANEADTRVSGAERHVMDMIVNNEVDIDTGTQVLDEIWNG